MVLISHVWPQKYFAGYFGVDMQVFFINFSVYYTVCRFFVISGYLMGSFMRPHARITVPIALKFYFRRFKRLLPMYLILVFATCFLSTIASKTTYYWILFKDVLSASVFVSNLPMFHRITYAFAAFKSVVLLHTWSLSTEMQFYLLVPPIFALSNWVQNKLKLNSQVVNVAIILCSFYYQQFWLVLTQARHMLMMSRLWQFGVGFVAFDLRQYLHSSVSFRSHQNKYEFYLEKTGENS